MRFLMENFSVKTETSRQFSKILEIFQFNIAVCFMLKERVQMNFIESSW